ncbi:ORF64 [Ranid herpesvirus 1]|uniref:ORF64 n=1 Tax=Ranid herpesvirus 1 TaxID=85655 RepID=Q14VP4_9VIRU|nr:ORF64 [Ranid herpesvirus 1]ABG25805.1 ORF64 [Ranid herpesvirus 1]
MVITITIKTGQGDCFLEISPLALAIVVGVVVLHVCILLGCVKGIAFCCTRMRRRARVLKRTRFGSVLSVDSDSDIDLYGRASVSRDVSFRQSLQSVPHTAGIEEIDRGRGAAACKASKALLCNRSDLPLTPNSKQ